MNAPQANIPFPVEKIDSLCLGRITQILFEDSFYDANVSVEEAVIPLARMASTCRIWKQILADQEETTLDCRLVETCDTYNGLLKSGIIEHSNHLILNRLRFFAHWALDFNNYLSHIKALALSEKTEDSTRCESILTHFILPPAQQLFAESLGHIQLEDIETEKKRLESEYDARAVRVDDVRQVCASEQILSEEFKLELAFRLPMLIAQDIREKDKTIELLLQIAENSAIETKTKLFESVLWIFMSELLRLNDKTDQVTVRCLDPEGGLLTSDLAKVFELLTITLEAAGPKLIASLQKTLRGIQAHDTKIRPDAIEPINNLLNAIEERLEQIQVRRNSM